MKFSLKRRFGLAGNPWHFLSLVTFKSTDCFSLKRSSDSAVGDCVVTSGTHLLTYDGQPLISTYVVGLSAYVLQNVRLLRLCNPSANNWFSHVRP